MNALKGAGARILFNDSDNTSQPIVEFSIVPTPPSPSFSVVYGFGASGDWQTTNFDLPQGGFDSAMTITTSIT